MKNAMRIGPSRLTGITVTSATLLILTVALAAPPAFGDSLNVLASSPGVVCPNTTVTSGSAISTCAPTSLSGLTVTSTASGDLATGTFGAMTTIHNSLSQTGGGSSQAFVTVIYDFAVSGTTSGTAEFAVALNGSLSDTQCMLGPNCAIDAEFAYPGSTASVGAVSLPPDYTTSALNGYPTSGGVTDIVVTTPIINGEALLDLSLSVYAACNGGSVCTSTADFLDPASITGAQVFDPNGALVPGASLISESGFDPNAGNALAAPEPSGFVPFGIAALILLSKMKFRVTCHCS